MIGPMGVLGGMVKVRSSIRGAYAERGLNCCCVLAWLAKISKFAS